LVGIAGVGRRKSTGKAGMDKMKKGKKETPLTQTGKQVAGSVGLKTIGHEKRDTDTSAPKADKASPKQTSAGRKNNLYLGKRAKRKKKGGTAARESQREAPGQRGKPARGEKKRFVRLETV